MFAFCCIVILVLNSHTHAHRERERESERTHVESNLEPQALRCSPNKNTVYIHYYLLYSLFSNCICFLYSSPVCLLVQDPLLRSWDALMVIVSLVPFDWGYLFSFSLFLDLDIKEQQDDMALFCRMSLSWKLLFLHD